MMIYLGIVDINLEMENKYDFCFVTMPQLSLTNLVYKILLRNTSGFSMQ